MILSFFDNAPFQTEQKFVNKVAAIFFEFFKIEFCNVLKKFFKMSNFHSWSQIQGYIINTELFYGISIIFPRSSIKASAQSRGVL